MRRLTRSWITEYVDYASRTEAPRMMHFFAGVGAVAGALRRKVWIDQYYFRWTPSFYIIFVAPPGVVSKSTTADIAMDLLREVPGINFGPDVVTWQALATAFAGITEHFPYNDEYHPMSALTLVASELGNLINPQDRDMINLYINLWDGRKSLEKTTKGSGCDVIEAPWINMLGCTTPHWIADNMPPATVGGGFTSRCIFVYAEKKEKYIAYPIHHIPQGIDQKKEDLIHDLEHIACNITGPYEMTKGAIEWGEKWYEQLWSTSRPTHLEDDRLDGYIARKQTHLHKLAIIMAACERDELIITDADLTLANAMLETTELQLPKVFSKIGKGESSLEVDRMLSYVKGKGEVPYTEVYRIVHSHFCDLKDFEGVLSGAIRAGYMALVQKGNELFIKWVGETL